MANFPTSLIDFQRRFPDEDACATWLFAARWPTCFRCPGCGAEKSWPHGGKRFTYECASCGKQTSVTAGTILHGSKLPLTVWFWASYLMSTHSNGISALQLQKQLALGSYNSIFPFLGAAFASRNAAEGGGEEGKNRSFLGEPERPSGGQRRSPRSPPSSRPSRSISSMSARSLSPKSASASSSSLMPTAAPNCRTGSRTQCGRFSSSACSR